MALLFFDTETTGFVLDRLPFDHPDQPSLVQFAAKLTEDDGAPISSVSLVVDPKRDIPVKASDIHGITTDFAERFGVAEATALGHYRQMRRCADVIVAHNAKFDVGVMACVAARLGVDLTEEIDTKIECTMNAATTIINLPPTERMVAMGFNKPKPPKLEECIQYFFNEALDGAHDALVDVDACKRVFFYLKSIGAITSEEST